MKLNQKYHILLDTNYGIKCEPYTAVVQVVDANINDRNQVTVRHLTGKMEGTKTDMNIKTLTKMKIKITKEVDQQMFEDIIVTSLEGGSNYWYLMYTEEFEKDLPTSSEPLSVRIAEALYNSKDFKLNVYDIESDDKELLGVVTFESCQKAFDIMSKDYTDQLSNFIEECYDADDADVFFQIATMGEVVFG